MVLKKTVTGMNELYSCGGGGGGENNRIVVVELQNCSGENNKIAVMVSLCKCEAVDLLSV